MYSIRTLSYVLVLFLMSFLCIVIINMYVCYLCSYMNLTVGSPNSAVWLGAKLSGGRAPSEFSFSGWGIIYFWVKIHKFDINLCIFMYRYEYDTTTTKN